MFATSRLLAYGYNYIINDDTDDDSDNRNDSDDSKDNDKSDSSVCNGDTDEGQDSGISDPGHFQRKLRIFFIKVNNILKILINLKTYSFLSMQIDIM